MCLIASIVTQRGPTAIVAASIMFAVSTAVGSCHIRRDG